jgi:hypothetical protein
MSIEEKQDGAGETLKRRGWRGRQQLAKMEVCDRIGAALEKTRRREMSEAEKTKVFMRRMFGKPPKGKGF